MSTYTSTFFGVDRKIVDQAIAKGRRERNQAIRAMVAGIFTSVADKRAETADASDITVGAAKVAHL